MASLVKVKSSDKSPVNRKNLLAICESNSIRVRSVSLSADGFILKCDSSSSADRLFDESVIVSLASLNFEPVMPHSLKANRSIIIKAVDDEVYSNELSDIEDEIIRCNPWIKLKEVLKFPNSQTIKLVFSTLEIADKCLLDGLFLFHLYISPSFIIRDSFHFIGTCYRCYAMDDHKAANCKKADTWKICSICSSCEHVWKDCKADFQKCINCGGDHSTLSMQCPKRKQILKEKRASSKSKPSYASVASARGHALADVGSIDLSATLSRSYSCIMLALLKNEAQPGSFQGNLDKLFSANGLPTISIGEFCPPSLSSLISSSVPKQTESLPDSGAVFPIVDVTEGSAAKQTASLPNDVSASPLEDAIGEFSAKQTVSLQDGGSVSPTGDVTEGSAAADFRVYVKKGSSVTDANQLSVALEKKSALILNSSDMIIPPCSPNKLLNMFNFTNFDRFVSVLKPSEFTKLLKSSTSDHNLRSSSQKVQS